MLHNRFIFFFPDGDGSGGEGGGGEGSGQESGTKPPPEGNDGSQEESSETVPASEAREARREAQALRKRAKAAEEELERLKSGSKSEEDKTAEERQKLEDRASKAETRARNLHVAVLARKAGIADDFVDVAAHLVDWDEIDDETSDKEVERALKALVKERPALAGGVRGRGDGGEGGREQDGTGSSMNDMIRAQLAHRRGA